MTDKAWDRPNSRSIACHDKLGRWVAWPELAKFGSWGGRVINCEKYRARLVDTPREDDHAKYWPHVKTWRAYRDWLVKGDL